MQVYDLKLDSIEFTQAPTKSQLVNALNDISTFISHMGGALILDDTYSVADQPLGEMLNASIMLKKAAAQFEAGPSASGLAVPQPGGPQVVRGR